MMEDSMSRRVDFFLPCDEPLWNKLSNEIEKLTTVNATEIEKLRHILKAIQTISEECSPRSPCLSPYVTSDFIFEGLIHFLEHDATPKEIKVFFERTLPTIASIALEIEHLKPPEPLRYSLQQQDHTLHLSRRFAASLLAHSFLCTLPTQDMVELNQINFKYFFKHLENLSLQKAQAAKLRCILHYFERLSFIWADGMPSGELTFRRKVFPQKLLPTLNTWETSEIPLCGFVVKLEGGIEDVGSGIIQVDFANRYIGGGVLSSGVVQEEIRFATCPELISGLPFLECLQDNEAMEISGFERYSNYSGYCQTFSFEGDFVDSTKLNSTGSLETKLLAIDASPFYDTSDDQFRDSYLLRDLNKALIGFLPCSEPEVPPNDEGSDVDISFYTDATDRSHYTTETDFETASESLDAPKTDQSTSYDLSHITNYGNALSKAITDIAVKDASIMQSGESSLLDESLDYSIDDNEDEENGTLGYKIDGNGDRGNLRNWSHFSEHPFVSKKILNFCNQLTQEVMISVVSNEPEVALANGLGTSHEGPLNGNGSLGEISKSKRHSGMIGLKTQREHLGEVKIATETKSKGPEAKVKTNLTGLVDDIVTSAVTEALQKKLGPASPSDNGSNHSGVGSSLGDFSVISSTSAHSETFVKVSAEGDYGDINPAGDKEMYMVEKFVAEVIDQAISVAKKLDNIEEEGNQGNISQSQNVRTVNLASGNGPSKSSCTGGSTVEASNLNDQGDKRTDNTGVASAQIHLPFNDLGNVMCQHPGSGHESLMADTERPPHGVPTLRGPVVNIEDGDAALPGTPPPSPSFQQFGSSSRSSFSEAELLIFGEELLELQNQEPRNHQKLRMVETFVEEYVDEDDDEDSELDHMIAAASRRSSSRSGSASSRPTNLDSFTEGLLKIGDIDPQGRRPSRTEESLQYFSAELAKRVEKDRYNLRRESDLDRFAFDLFHGVTTAAEPEPVKTINEDIAVTYASRLAADVMQDVAIQMFGAVFPHSVRLIPAREGDFPPRREPSETDIISLAANLANTILESAMKAYRRDFLGNLSETSPSVSITGESESELYSRCAQIDENSVCDSAVEDIQFSSVQDVPYQSVDEMAWNLACKIVSEAGENVRKIKVLQQIHEQSLLGDQCPIATGNWGCGAFGGDPQLKSLIQWMAASQAGVPVVYYFSYGDRRVEELSDVVQLLRMRGWTVGKMVQLIREYCHQKTAFDLREDLFRHILSKKFTA
ncbi:Poly(ADP-ribose) glycohydrolase [Holothuria leucospilota]|uniref:poly(ADP-ribose) glycohydrolase n=1 Tax=Holothuria leucospilota TaxID=206669 RepID=A0A9Q1BR46_HOLLE|nr:Poly(ADP-ribose) glycohydrolase [Holothuria leucospilota]